MRIFYILILILYWSILILGPINARADDKWSFEKLDGFNYGALAGEVTHGDKLRFIMIKGHCDMIQHVFTFYTYEKPKDISQLNGQKIPIQINDIPDLEAKVFMVRPFLMGYQVWFSLGSHKVDEYKKILNDFDRFEIKILDGYGFKASKYFDITANNWELKDVGDAFQKMKNDCLEISEIENELIS